MGESQNQIPESYGPKSVESLHADWSASQLLALAGSVFVLGQRIQQEGVAGCKLCLRNQKLEALCEQCLIKKAKTSHVAMSLALA